MEVDAVIDPTPSSFYQAQFDFTDSDVAVTFTQNETTILCSLSGPTELPSSTRLNDKMLTTVVYTLENGSQSSSTEINGIIDAMVDKTKFPRSGLVINLHQLTDNGSRLSVAINCASLALLDSAVQLEGLFLAVSVILNHDGTIFVDPTKDQEVNAKAVAVVVFKNSNGELEPVGFLNRGCIDMNFYSKAVEETKKQASELLAYFRRIMKERLVSKNTD
uniref:Exoribonuclease phosphorolytic domain-containing protein n=1 Tax=Panagrolaimus sp. JU765 TaxID=591449 RepID=A0AC34Q7R0_9BILA